MKNFLNPRRLATSSVVTKTISRLLDIRLGLVFALSFAIIVVVSPLASYAQGSGSSNKVSSVSAEPSGNGTVVSMAADSPMARPQNWSDNEGYHLVFPNVVPSATLMPASGVRVRRVGTSMEVLLQTRPGSKVNLEPNGNRVNLVIDRKLDARPLAADSKSASGDQAGATSGEDANATGNWSPPADTFAELPPEPFPKRPAVGATPDYNAKTVGVLSEDEGFAASIFSGTGIVVLMTFGLFGLLVSRKFSSRGPVIYPAESVQGKAIERDEVADESPMGINDTQRSDPRSSLVKSGGTSPTNGSSRQPAVRMTVAGPMSLYGAYRIDQEVSKLVLGQPHRMDVLGSRALDDRRAIETSLMKSLNSFDLDQREQRRAREALEEYGFVARQCAALLLAADPFDRTSAARSLGEIKSEQALPFLLESLYDSESIVRNQVVVSLGELKHPSAIGALLDIARSCPDVPNALLSKSLSACSVEGLDFFDGMGSGAQLGMGSDLSIIEQITHLEPSSLVEELPAASDDEQLAQALELLENSDAQERSEALKVLTQFRVQSSVAAITRVARHDPEPNLRSIAIASLGTIDHESVFPAILTGMTDDTREVRASAARALNRLSFDRADAYVRAIETSDDETLREVAQACVQAGIVSQNLDRLGSSDHRQAYETFSLICLLAKAKMNEPILSAIENHSNVNVSIRAVYLLASTGQPGTVEQLRELADKVTLHEEIKTALLVALYRLDQNERAEEEDLEVAEEEAVLATEPAVAAEDEPVVGTEGPAVEAVEGPAVEAQEDPAVGTEEPALEAAEPMVEATKEEAFEAFKEEAFEAAEEEAPEPAQEAGPEALKEQAVEAAAPDSELQFEESEEEAAEDDPFSGIQFDFRPASQRENMPASETEMELNRDQLEL